VKVVIGIDPGTAACGYGIVHESGDRLEHPLGDVEVRVDVLDVVVVLELVHEAEDLLRIPLVRHLDGRLRDHRQLGRVDRVSRSLDRLAHRRELLRRGGHLKGRAVALDVVCPAFCRSERQLVLVDAVGRHLHDPASLEEPRDGSGAAEISVVLRERVPNVARRAVSVVGQRLHDHGDAARAVALVHDRLELARVGVGARPLRDRAIDVVLRHGVGARLLDRVLQREVGGRVAAAFLRGHDDRPRQLREELAALRVRRALLVLDRRPLAMPGHSTPPVSDAETARGCACRR
jgi:hypothetical protein